MGKSSLIAMFLGTQRDLIRISTPVATEPLHLTPIRDVSTSRLTAKWEMVDYERLSCMIARTCKDLFLRKGEEGDNGRENRQANGRSAGETIGNVEESSESVQDTVTEDISLTNILFRFLSKLGKFFRRSAQTSQQGESEEFEHNGSEQLAGKPALPLENNLEVDHENIQEHFSNFLDGLQEKVRNAKAKDEVLLSHSIRIVDSGGQPQFHELIAIFLAHISGILSVFKLNEAFSAHGEVVLYDNGKPVSK